MTTATLPEHDDMLRRLKSVIDEPHTANGFYPLLLADAGQEKTPEGIGLMFIMAIAVYAGQIPASQMTLNVALPRFIAALVDDEDAQREAVAFLQEAQQ